MAADSPLRVGVGHGTPPCVVGNDVSWRTLRPPLSGRASSRSPAVARPAASRAAPHGHSCLRTCPREEECLRLRLRSVALLSRKTCRQRGGLQVLLRVGAFYHCPSARNENLQGSGAGDHGPPGHRGPALVASLYDARRLLSGLARWLGGPARRGTDSGPSTIPLALAPRSSSRPIPLR